MSSIVTHALPDQRRGRLMLALIVALLALPFGIAAALYFGGWQPARTIQHGNLLSPPQLLPEALLRSTGKNREKWIFMLRINGTCKPECIARLDEMRRIHVALYKNMGRLSRAVLTDHPNDPALLALQAAQPDLLLLTVTPDAPLASADPLLLIDPQGQLIMTYPADAPPQDMRADLERLLKFAWNG